MEMRDTLKGIAGIAVVGAGIVLLLLWAFLSHHHFSVWEAAILVGFQWLANSAVLIVLAITQRKAAVRRKAAPDPASVLRLS